MTTPESGDRFTVKELTQKMLEGENEFVMKYLKTLPKEECKETRARLIKNLEEIQKKKKNGTVGRSGRTKPKEEGPIVPSTQPLLVANNVTAHGSVGKSSGSSSGTGRRKPKHRKHIETSEKETIGSYTLDEEIDKYAFGLIYKASHCDTGATVCVKQIEKDLADKDKLPAVMKETELLLTFNHPSITKFIDVVDTKKSIYLISENITRGSLLKLVQTYGNFPESLCAVCISQTLEALAYVHSKGLRHDNVRCNNIMITNLGFVKLSGFGNIRQEDMNKDAGVQLEPYWMAPEVADNGSIGLPADIWSLGCSVIELLSGEPPHSSLSNSQALSKILDEDYPPLPPGLSPELTKFLLSGCFVKDSKRRSTAQNLLVHPWLKLYESARKESNTYSEIVAILRKANPNKKVREEDLELQVRELTLERDALKMQNQELKDKIAQAQQKKKL